MQNSSPPLPEILSTLTRLAEQQGQLLNRLGDVAVRLIEQQAGGVERSESEEAILDGLAEGVLNSQQLANQIERENSGSFRQELSAMVRRGLLVKAKGGYQRGPAAA